MTEGPQNTQSSALSPQHCGQPSRWLITGGCGFIGTNLIAHLIKENPHIKIRVVDNLSVGTREDLARVCNFSEKSGVKSQENSLLLTPNSSLEKGSSLLTPHSSLSSKVELVIGDIRNQETCLKATEGIDAIIHLAAHAGVIPSIENPRFDCEVNVLGTLNYLESARINGVKKFIFASSGAPLGEQSPPIHEEKVPKPISPYGASKLAGEAYCMAYHGSFGLQTIILRFGNVYGPHSKHKDSVIAKFIKQALKGEPLVIYGDGNQTRDFIYVEDLIDAIMSAAHANLGGEIFQIATHRETTVNEIAKHIKKIIEELIHKSVQIIYNDPRVGEIMRNFSDITKARQILRWKPKWALDKGLKATIKWFLQNS